MCDYINEHWNDATPIHLGAYIMWRLNWIHPFADGNGRTSRILSYVVLSIRAGALCPAHRPSPIRSWIIEIRYFDALDAADRAWKEGRIDLAEMEELLGSLLARQLASFYEAAGGKIPASST